MLLLTLQTDTLRENCPGKAESPLLILSLPSDLADSPMIRDAQSTRLRARLPGQLPAEKLNLNTF